MNPEYEKEISALKLLHRDWDGLSEDDRSGLYDSFVWAVSSAVESGLVQWPSPDRETGE